jgi:glutamate-1-semialdehyde 2,1-aminomutase
MKRPETKPNSGAALYERAKKLIPGGTQLLSKRPELFLPEGWPTYYRSANGAEIVDLDGNRYLDFTHCGVGTCILGYADPDVDAAVLDVIRRGSMSTLNSPDEVTLAEVLIDAHPWAGMVRYARTGGEAMAIAARIARAASGRSTIAFCGYHGWADWYLAANIESGSNLSDHLLPGLAPKGVPPALEGSVVPFRYNHIEDLEQIVERRGNDLAAIIMEPQRSAEPSPTFIADVRALAEKNNAVLVIDEVTSGYRMNTGGLHLLQGVEPDIAVFAKGMSNGYPMAAVIGKTAVMEAAQDTFISSTYWTESIGPAAALATIAKHEANDVPAHLIATGDTVGAGWRAAADAAGLSINVSGLLPLNHFAFDHPQSLALATFFTQEMLKRGFLATGQLYAMYAHDDELVGRYLDTVAEVFALIADRIDDSPDTYLDGPVKHAGFQRLN